MKVEKVSANIRYSKAQEGGAWKTVELAAEASVTPSENWQEAQAQLYAELGQQLKALWGNGNGNHKAENGAVAAAEARLEPEPIRETPAPALEHYCQEHSQDFRKHEKGSQVWYSHRLAEGGYCRER